jgi:hypothetical protein
VVKIIGELFNVTKDWEFLSIDSTRRSMGLVIGSRKSLMRLIKSTIFDSRIGVELFSLELGEFFSIANIYGPYEDKVAYWEELI